MNISEKLDIIEISMNDILIAMNKLNCNKAKGKTFIDNIVIKNCLNGVSKLLYFLFNKIIEYQKIPQKLKESIVSPILKSGKNKHLFTSYRSVSVQPNIFRIFENILNYKLLPFIERNEILPKTQYGYRTKIGLNCFHTDLQKVLYKSLNDKKVIGIDMIFLDLTDAFDKCNQKILLAKLKSFNICGTFFEIISDIFKSREQVVKYKNKFSGKINQISGIIQGGVLSPLFFNIYTSDIINHIQSKLFLFADDMVIVRPIHDINDCLVIQNDLNSIQNYCELNNLKLNPLKCESMRITLKNNTIFDYKLNDISLQNVDKHKQIGILYDSRLVFDFHTDMISEKSLKKFYVIKNICKRVDSKTFLKLYQTFVIPILEYSNLSLVYTESQSDKLEKIQRRITKYICSKDKKFDLKYEKRLEFLNIFSLNKRRKIQILKQLFNIKINSKFANNKWLNELQFYNNERNGIFCKINVNRLHKSDKYIFDFSVKLFNDLPKDIRCEVKLNKFLCKLNDYF